MDGEKGKQIAKNQQAGKKNNINTKDEKQGGKHGK